VAEYASAHLSRNLEVELGNMGALQGSEQVWAGYVWVVVWVELGRGRWYEHRVCPHTHMYAAPPPYTITKQVGKALVRAFERTDRGVIQKVHHAFEIGLGNVAKVRKNKQAQSIGSRMV
jgi:hypothetical protein